MIPVLKSSAPDELNECLKMVHALVTLIKVQAVKQGVPAA